MLRVPTHAKRKPVTGRQPISSIGKSIGLSKSTDINLQDFRLPPQTPSSAGSKTWRPGSGFKGTAKVKAATNSTVPTLQDQAAISGLAPLARPGKQQHQVGQRKHHASRENDNLTSRKPLLVTESSSLSMPEIETPHVITTLEIPCESNPVIARPYLPHQSKSPQALGEYYSVATSKELSPGQRPSYPASQSILQPRRIRHPHCRRQAGLHGAAGFRPSTHDDATSGVLPVSAPSHKNISSVAPTIHPCLSDRSMGRFPLSKRGLSFSLSPMRQVKGDLDLSISSRLQRMASMPFVPPLKRVA